MKIEKDKIAHTAIGCVTVCGVLLILWLACDYGLGPALAAATTLMGVAIELYQRVRREGTVDPFDAVFTAAPGFVAWLILAVAR